MWTHFWDMHSGGGSKADWEHIYIEAPEQEAKSVFYSRLGHNPERVSCTCCGEDYSISEEASLEQLTGFHRNCRYARPAGDWRTMTTDQRIEANERGRYLNPGEEVPDGFVVEHQPRGEPLWIDEYLARENVLVIRSEQILDEERTAAVPDQGYVWVD